MMHLLFSQIAMASAGASHHEFHLNTFLFQTVNVVVLLALLYKFSAQKVREYFRQKRSDFLAVAERAEKARMLAEQDFQSMNTRLDKLQREKLGSLEKAKSDAASLQVALRSEATTLISRIQEEAKRAAQAEVSRASQELREELVKESISLTREKLTSQVSREDHQRLQGNFISNIEAVER